MALTPYQKARVDASNAKSKASQEARKQAASNVKPTGIVHSVAGETAAQRTARTQANVKSAAAQTAAVLHPAPGSNKPKLSSNKGQVYSGSKLVADYGYGAQADALANRYVTTNGQNFGAQARSEGQAVTPELAPYSPVPAMPVVTPVQAPVKNTAPVERNVDAEAAARDRISTERNIDTTKASAATLSLLNEAVNEDVYGKSRPNFAKSQTVTQPKVVDSTPDITTSSEVASIVTSDSAEKYQADALANITDLQGQSFDTAASGFDGLIGTDYDVLSAQAAGIDAQALLEERRSFYQEQYISLKSETSRIYAEKAADYKQQAAQAMGSTISQLAAMGALGTTTAGIQYVNDVDRVNQAKLVSFAAEEASALETAYNAFREADFDTAKEMIDNAKATREEIRTIKTEALANQKTVLELKKLEREDASQTITAMVESGLDINTLPEGYLSYLDAKGGYASGTSEGLWNVAQKERALKDIKDEQALQTESLNNAKKLVEVLNDIPVGQSVSIDGVNYMSIQKGDVTTGSEMDSNGNVTVWSLNKDTGDIKTYSMGNIGSPEGWELTERNGIAGLVNTKTGAVKVLGDSSSPNFGHAEGGILDLFPQGSISSIRRHQNEGSYARNVWMDAQCGSWTNDMTGIGVGDTWEQKQSKMTNVLSDNIQERLSQPPSAGDVFVQKIGSSNLGHVGIVNSATPIYNEAGEIVDYELTLSESNWSTTKSADVLSANGIDPSILNDPTVAQRGIGIVTHNRTMKLSDKKLTGFASPGFKNPAYNFIGTDSSAETSSAMDTFLSQEDTGDESASIPQQTQIRKEILNDSAITQYSALKNSYSSLDAVAKQALSAPTDESRAQTDQALITLFNKMLDPTSVVREGEYARTTQGQSVLSRAQGYIQQLTVGGEGIDDATRQAAVDVAKTLFDVAKGQYQDSVDFYIPVLEQYGLDPKLFIKGYATYSPTTEGNGDVQSGDQFVYTDRNDPDIQEAINAGYTVETRIDGTVVVTAP